jgi:hypothetical protein
LGDGDSVLSFVRGIDEARNHVGWHRFHIVVDVVSSPAS